MQRIDENTYIDDTLVTCAEYQLFIDEMREQGKYYQPDHWSSYEFPEGQGQEPILGVRYSDAVAFCEWLRQREGVGWKYHLLTQKEALQFPMKVLRKCSIGYWVLGDTQFSWLDLVPQDARKIEIDFNRARTLDRAHIIDFANTLDVASTFNLVNALDRALNRAHALDLTRALNFVKTLNIVIALDLAGILDSALDRGISSLHNYGFVLDFEDARSRAGALALARLGDRTRAIGRARASARDLTLSLSRSYDRDLDLALDCYIDIYTLLERIAGRSPAFEGIRIVKERIK